jgi:dihydropteroate synthase
MFTLNCKGVLLTIDQPLVMGIINTTPDSFFAGSRTQALDAVVSRAEQMVREGAAILDLGGQSTRPGSSPVSASEEAERVIPAVEAVHRNFPDQQISIDTFYAAVARQAIAAGASIVNDVSAGSLDEGMIPTVAKMGVPYVLMHMPGTPQNMQDHPPYKNVTLEVFDFLSFKIAELRQAGIKDIIIDPGFGFGKNAADNFQLLKRLYFFRELDKPLMVGLSRKATVYKTLGVDAGAALNGSTVLHTIALLNGATILRVHDVKEAMEAIRLVGAYQKEKEQE